MNDVIIFIFGFVVTGMTVVATILVGLSEAGETDHTREEDLSKIEKKLVGDKRKEQE